MNSIFGGNFTGRAILVGETELPKVLAKQRKYIEASIILPDGYALVIFTNERGHKNED